jgi:hypothetical protein
MTSQALRHSALDTARASAGVDAAEAPTPAEQPANPTHPRDANVNDAITADIPPPSTSSWRRMTPEEMFPRRRPGPKPRQATLPPPEEDPVEQAADDVRSQYALGTPPAADAARPPPYGLRFGLGDPLPQGVVEGDAAAVMWAMAARSAQLGRRR